MRLTQTFPECVDCLRKLSEEVVHITCENHDALVKRDARKRALRIIDEGEKAGLTSPEIANRFLRLIRGISGIRDPYAAFKKEEIRQAFKIFSDARQHVGDDLRSAVNFAALGNSLDFFKVPLEALAEIPNRIKEGILFHQDDLDRLNQFLDEKPQMILYLTDNSGEIYFDLPLYEYLKRRSKRIVLVVKGGPALNDLTAEEIKMAGLEEAFDEIADTGADGAGVDWNQTSEKFLSLLNEADLLLSKGMANFETTFFRSLPLPVFFIFRVKCKAMENFLHASEGSFMALWRNEHAAGQPG